MDEPVVPYFVKRFFYVHKYGRRVAIDVSGTQGCLGKVEEIVVGRVVVTKTSLLGIDFVIDVGPVG